MGAAASHANGSAVYLGLDFGTSNSVAALARGAEVHPVRFGDGTTMQRTLFFFPDDSSGVKLGNEAAEAYYRASMAGRLVQSLKSHLAGDLEQLTFGPIVVGIEALLATFLRFLRAEASRVAGEDLRRVILGRPVRFHLDDEANTRASRRLRAAAELAGFEEIAFQYEPIAAALDYEQSTERDEIVLVGDLGGDTSDFAVVRVGPHRGLHDRARDVLATAGVPLAGNALDRDVMRRRLLPHFGAGATWSLSPGVEPQPWSPALLQEIVDLPRIPLLRDRHTDDYLNRMRARVRPSRVVGRVHDLIFKDLGFSLTEAIEAAKVELSRQARTRIQFSEASIAIDHAMDRARFDSATTTTVERIVGGLDEVIATANVDRSEISRVFLTGGTSQVPALQHIFADRFGADRVFVGDVFTSVARGLALSWPLLAPV